MSTREPAAPGAALLTDRYELTMLESLIGDGYAGRRAVFEVFTRRLPPGRRYGVAAGLGRLAGLAAGFHFTGAEVDALVDEGVVSAATAPTLRGLRFTGAVDAYREGELYGPYSPVLTVEAPLGEALLLETLLLSVLNHDSAVAAAAARMAVAAAGRTLIEMGGRRTHERAAVDAARAAYVAGFDATSNLAAGDLYGIPTTGTAAHAFVLAHPSEREAFQAQVRRFGPGTTLLVDTYDIEQGIRTAVDVAGPALGAVRIDSGDLAEESRRARALLDSLGATGTRIVITSDVDEYIITALADAPIDAFGVGTRLVTGSGAPTAGMVYKLVAIADGEGQDAPLRPVAKRARGKTNPGGRKAAWRLEAPDSPDALPREMLLPPGVPPPAGARPLQVRVVERGDVVHDPSLAQIRAHHLAARRALPREALGVADGPPVLSAAPVGAGTVA